MSVDCGCPSDIKPSSYCLRLYDCGHSGSCDSELEMTLVFNGVVDALTYIKDKEIPHILEDNNEISSEQQAQIKTVIQNIDALLKQGSLTNSSIDALFKEFNKTFDPTNPKVQIFAHGFLNEYICSDYMKDLMKEYKQDYESDDFDELYILASKGKFDPQNEQHLEMARDFLEEVERL